MAVLAGVGQHFSRNLDQYTIMCVFGSVVGCVVLPLVAQSLESFIITAILLGVTVKTLNKKQKTITAGGGVVKEAQEEKKKEKKARKVTPRRQNHGQHVQPILENVRHQREQDILRMEESRLQEKEKRCEEKREKKAKKRVQRLKKREEEKVEREREESAYRKRQRERELRKMKNKPPALFPTVETVSSMLADQKPLRRERKYSTSSSASSVSIPTHKGKLPKRASSVPLISATPPTTPLGPLSQPQQVTVPSHSPEAFISPVPSSFPLQFHPNHQLFPIVPHPHLFGAAPFPVFPDPVHLPNPGNTSQIADRPPGQMSLQHAWLHVDTSMIQNVTADSAISGPSSDSVLQQLQAPSTDSIQPTPLGMCGPAQGFYSLLNQQALSMDSSPESNIWSPPTSDPPQWGEKLDDWPII